MRDMARTAHWPGRRLRAHADRKKSEIMPGSNPSRLGEHVHDRFQDICKFTRQVTGLEGFAMKIPARDTPSNPSHFRTSVESNKVRGPPARRSVGGAIPSPNGGRTWTVRQAHRRRPRSIKHRKKSEDKHLHLPGTLERTRL